MFLFIRSSPPENIGKRKRIVYGDSTGVIAATSFVLCKKGLRFWIILKAIFEVDYIL